jgi:2-oxoglutarate ferredoxin oxidoreductase subunit alpha
MAKSQHENLNIVIGGKAGQGLATFGELLAKSLVRCGYDIVVTQNYQSRVRGGHNCFGIRTSDRVINAPQEPIDLLIALDKETIHLHRDEVVSSGLIISNAAFGETMDGSVQVPFKDLTSDRYFNSAALGVVTQMLNMDYPTVEKTLEDLLTPGHAEEVKDNKKAFKAGTVWFQENEQPSMSLRKVTHQSERLMMNGNEGIALGAVAGGLRFFSFYPMSPATSIAVTLAKWAKPLGMIVEQAEDEIAVINMALGASFTGAPSMVATSGGGFALMVEGVSLAAMTETPVVIVIAQRPAPATGLPTRTEQADLEFVLHAGHGEFPRAIFSPGSVEECFELTRKALELAERYQGPVFILTDQFLADSYRAVKPFESDMLALVQPWEKEGDSFQVPYHRYALTENGVSPRLLPGLTKHLVVADSDEHNEEGHITENFEVRNKMVQKRLIKGKGILAKAMQPVKWGDDDPDLLMVCWGSSAGAVKEASNNLSSEGVTSGFISFSQVWPLVPENFTDSLKKARKVVCVESNATGQFARLLRRETGFSVHQQLLRYDGLPLTPEYILRELII